MENSQYSYSLSSCGLKRESFVVTADSSRQCVEITKGLDKMEKSDRGLEGICMENVTPDGSRAWPHSTTKLNGSHRKTQSP